MPFHEYRCSYCGATKDWVYQRINKYTIELCPDCHREMERLISSGNFLYSDVQNPYFSHSLGEVVKGRHDEKKRAKDKGFIELGNDKPGKFIKPKRQEYTIDG